MVLECVPEGYPWHSDKYVFTDIKEKQWMLCRVISGTEEVYWYSKPCSFQKEELNSCLSLQLLWYCFDYIIHHHAVWFTLCALDTNVMKDGPMQSFINSVYQHSHGAHAVPFGPENKVHSLLKHMRNFL